MPIACAPAAQAETVPKDWPRRSCFIAITPEAALAISSGIESGEMRSAPSLLQDDVLLASSVPMPPIPVPITEPRGPGRTGGPSSQPASSSASAAAARASCVKRSERRTSLTERWSLGSNSVARP